MCNIHVQCLPIFSVRPYSQGSSNIHAARDKFSFHDPTNGSLLQILFDGAQLCEPCQDCGIRGFAEDLYVHRNDNKLIAP
jgi:hypothetical protein